MADSLHPAAPHNLPIFIAEPGDTDVLMMVVAVILAVAVLGFGVLFLRLHTLPERIAHKGHKLQFEIVAVLGLISLFTHMHIFWIVGLLLALVDLPDFGTPLNRIAGSAEKIAGIKPSEAGIEVPSGIVASGKDRGRENLLSIESAEAKRSDGVAPSREGVRASQHELPNA
jgi:hypothetical protein